MRAATDSLKVPYTPRPTLIYAAQAVHPATLSSELAHLRQSKPDSGRGFQVKDLNFFKWSPLRSEADSRQASGAQTPILQKRLGAEGKLLHTVTQLTQRTKTLHTPILNSRWEAIGGKLRS